MSNPAGPGIHNDVFKQLAEQNADREAQLQVLWAMSPTERTAAYWRGELSGVQLRSWANLAPHELPLTSLDGQGEYHWILCKTPEYLGEFD